MKHYHACNSSAFVLSMTDIKVLNNVGLLVIDLSIFIEYVHFTKELHDFGPCISPGRTFNLWLRLIPVIVLRIQNCPCNLMK